MPGLQILLRARQIYLIGDGHDRVVAEYLRYALLRAGRPVHLLLAGDGTAEHIVRLITPRDTVIAVCSASHSDATALLGRAAARQGVPLVVLSGWSGQSFGEIRDHRLPHQGCGIP